MVFERSETLSEAALGMQIGEEKVEADDEDETCYDGPFDDVAGLERAMLAATAWWARVGE